MTLILFILLGNQSAFFCQQDNYWYFGNTAGLNFNTTPPTALTNGQSNISDNTSTISDNYGNLLFYSNGLSVWNKNHQVMPNGSGLIGSVTGGQPALIVPIPCDSSRYVIFQLTEYSSPGYLSYSVVDMSLNNGLGDVVSTMKNVSLGSGWCEKLCAYYYPAGNFYWVLAHKWGNSDFVALKLTATTIGTQSVVTSIGSVHSCGVYSGVHDAMGQLTISPDGSKVLNSLTCLDKYELFNFNLTTGVLSNSIQLAGDGGNAWGNAFSPSSNMIYTSSIFGKSVLQYDITNYSGTAIAATKYSVATMPSTGYNFGYMELGPNNKLYIARPSTSSLSVVHNPNTWGAGSNFTLAGQSLGVKASTHGISRIAYNIQPGAAPLLTLSASANSICAGQTVTIAVSGGYTYQWSTGATSSVIVVSPQTNTLYSVLSGSNLCVTTVHHSLTVFPTPTITIVASNTLLCPGETITITASGANSYSWNTAFTGPSFTVAPSTPVSFSLQGGSPCTDTESISIGIKPAPTLSFTTFSITCASLGSATLGVSGGGGPFTYSWSPTNQTGSVATGLYPGDYTLTVHDLSTGCVFTPTTNFGALIPLTGTVLSQDSVACFGAQTASANVILAGGSGNQTYTWTNSSATFNTPNPNTLPAGLYTVHVSDQLTYCSITKTFVVLQPTQNTLNITASSPSVCLGGSIQLTANNSGGILPYSYTWSTGNSSQVITVQENTAGSPVYTATSLDAKKCITTKTIAPIFVPNPTVVVSSASICPGKPATLLAFGASSYVWSTGHGSSILVVSPLVASSYSVVGSAQGCTSTASGSVHIYSSPVSSFTTNSPICQTDTLILSGSGGVSYLWSGPMSFTSSQSNTFIASPVPAYSGEYTLRVTSVEGCTAQSSSSIVVHPIPFFIVSTATVCEGSALPVNSSYVAGATYSWSGPSFGSSQQNNVIPNAGLSHAGIYELKVTSAFGCTASVSGTAVVASPSALSFFGTTAICEGDTLNLTGSGQGSIVWNGPNLAYSAQQNLTIANVSTLAAGFYTLSLNDGICLTDTSIMVNINPTPRPFIIFSPEPVCENASSVLGTNLVYSTYNWTGPDNFQSNNPSPQLNAKRSSAGIYTINVIDQNACKGKGVGTLHVLHSPTISAANGTVCLGGIATLSVSGADKFTWTGPGAFSASGNSIFISAVSPSNSGVYSVVGTGSNGCTSTETISLVSYSFSLPNIKVGGDPSVCLNAKIQLVASGGITYHWKGPKAHMSNDDTLNIDATEMDVSGIYSLTVKNQSLCAASLTVPVTVFAPPASSINVSRNGMCIPFCTTITNIAPQEGVRSIRYNFNGSHYQDSAVIVCVDKPGDYLTSVTVVDTNGCSNSSTVMITAYKNPVADFNFYPEKPVVGIDKVHFTNLSSTNNATFNWYFGAQDSSSVHESDPSYLFSEAGLYPIVLEIINEWGCRDTVIKPIIVYDDFFFYVPDAFTPNGDGINEVFAPKGQGIREYSLRVYDRWGEEIFFTKDFTTGWDGTYHGQKCQLGVYTWTINLKTESEKVLNYSGKVTLIR